MAADVGEAAGNIVIRPGRGQGILLGFGQNGEKFIQLCHAAEAVGKLDILKFQHPVNALFQCASLLRGAGKYRLLLAESQGFNDAAGLTAAEGYPDVAPGLAGIAFVAVDEARLDEEALPLMQSVGPGVPVIALENSLA